MVLVVSVATTSSKRPAVKSPLLMTTSTDWSVKPVVPVCSCVVFPNKPVLSVTDDELSAR